MAKDARLIHGRKLSEKFAAEVPLVEDLLNTKGSMDPYGSQAVSYTHLTLQTKA